MDRLVRFCCHPKSVAVVSVLLLGVYSFAALGVMPSPGLIIRWIGSVAGERFPCENGGCGCASATECWTSCCCRTEEQRLVWAIENGVPPPRGVDFADEQWIAAANAVTPGAAHCGLCVERIKDENRRGITRARAFGIANLCKSGECHTCGKSCGHRAIAANQTNSPESTSPECAPCCDSERDAARFGPTMSALGCKGLTELLMFGLPPTLPLQSVTFVLPEPLEFVPGCTLEPVHSSRILEVPEPPPRSIALMS